MAAPTELSLESVRVFILQRGGQVTNQEIAKHFRQFLKDPTKPELKELFKDYVKVVAVVKKVNNEKVIKLRSEYSYAPLQATPSVSSSGSQGTINTSEEYLDNEVFYDPQPIGLPEPLHVTRITQSQSSPDILLTNLKQEEKEKLMVEAPPGDGGDPHGPTAPPRKKSYKENKKPRAPPPPNQDDKNNEDDDNDEQTPRISVKEQASKLNKIASESQINLKPHSVTPKKRDKEKNDGEDDEETVSSAVDQRSREFFLKCAQGDYHALTRLLRDDPHLAKHKDVIYTALHWAAKRGHSDMVKLIAGTFGLNANIRSGDTPLHLAAMHNHRAVYDLLIQTYGADASMRDYSGKKAQQLFKDWKKGNSEQLRRQKERKTNDRDVCFLRIGSLNVKVRKTTEKFTLPEVNLRKGWGSADSVAEGVNYKAAV